MPYRSTSTRFYYVDQGNNSGLRVTPDTRLADVGIDTLLHRIRE